MRFSWVIGMAMVIAAPSAFAEQVWVTMDQVRTYTTKQEAASIIVGNPGIADVSVQDNNNFLLFGKAPGLTNIMILDENGKITQNLQVRVNPPGNNMLVFHRGKARTTYNCTTHCEATLTVGDDNSNFSAVNSQVAGKIAQATNGVSGDINDP